MTLSHKKINGGQRKGKRTRPETGIPCVAFFCKNISLPDQSLSGGYWTEMPDGKQIVTRLFHEQSTNQEELK